MCANHFIGYFGDTEDNIMEHANVTPHGVSDVAVNDDIIDSEHAHAATCEHEDEESESDDDDDDDDDEEDSDMSNNREENWPVCDECGAAEETRDRSDGRGWICYDCRYKHGVDEPDPEDEPDAEPYHDDDDEDEAHDDSDIKRRKL